MSESEQRANALDVLRAALLVVFAVGQMVAGFLPDLLGWDVSIASRSAEFNSVLIPAGWAFLIWLPLFVGNIGFAIYHALPSRLIDPLLRRLGWLAVIAFGANSIRSIYEPLNGPDWISFIMLETILLPFASRRHHLGSVPAPKSDLALGDDAGRRSSRVAISGIAGRTLTDGTGSLNLGDGGGEVMYPR